MNAAPTPDRAHPPRGADGEFIRRPDTAARDAKACELRAYGWTYEKIANELGYTDRSHARQGIERAMLAIVQEPAEEMIKIHLERLREMYRTAREIMVARHMMVQHGKVVTITTDTGEHIPVEDPMPKLAAIDRMTRVLEREAKLLGMDAPKQIEFITLDAIQAEIRRLEESMAVREKVQSA
jgi:hypothetical protein